jgi:hypothetical protein
VTTDPQFVNAESDDFRPQNTAVSEGGTTLLTGPFASYGIKGGTLTGYIGAYGALEDITPPEFSSATINGATLLVNWNENCTRGAGYANSDFNLDMSTTGNDIGVTYVSGDGTTQWQFTSASSAAPGETVDLDFVDAGGDSVEDDSGNDLADLTSETVTNTTYVPSTYTATGIVWDGVCVNCP